MKSICCRWLLLSVCSVTLPNLSWAVIYAPGDSVPGVPGQIFTWSALAPHSTNSIWNGFDNFPGGSAPGFLPAGTSPAPQSSFSGDATTSELTFQSNANITSGGNAYGGLFSAIQDPSFLTDAFATVRSGTSGGPYTRIVLQFETLGSELDYSSLLLSLSPLTPGTISPSYAIETDRTVLVGGFGGERVSYLALWDLETSQDEFRIDFMASAFHMSLESFRIDSLTQNSPFVTPGVVPEPSSSLAIASLAISGLTWRRHRVSSRRDAKS